MSETNFVEQQHQSMEGIVIPVTPEAAGRMVMGGLVGEEYGAFHERLGGTYSDFMKEKATLAFNRLQLNRPEAVGLALYGSVARGEAEHRKADGSTSDLDAILVIDVDKDPALKERVIRSDSLFKDVKPKEFSSLRMDIDYSVGLASFDRSILELTGREGAASTDDIEVRPISEEIISSQIEAMCIAAKTASLYPPDSAEQKQHLFASRNIRALFSFPVIGELEPYRKQALDVFGKMKDKYGKEIRDLAWKHIAMTTNMFYRGRDRNADAIIPEDFDAAQLANDKNRQELGAGPNVPEQKLAEGLLPHLQQEIAARIDDAINNGIINVIPVSRARDHEGLTISAAVTITNEMMADSGIDFDALPPYISVRTAKESGVDGISSVQNAEARAVKEAVIDEIIDRQAWFLADRTVSGELAEQAPAEIYKVLFGEHAVDIFNFSDVLLSAEKQVAIQKVLTRAYNTSGGRLAECLRGIAILPQSKFEKDKILAHATIKSGTITINDVLLSDERFKKLEEKYGKTNDLLGADSALEANLTHEATHLLEGLQSDYSEHRFGPAVGWGSKEVHSFTDDYGNVISRQVIGRNMPARAQQLRQPDGSFKVVDVVEAFGRDAYLNNRPVTLYAGTDNREDLAESSVAQQNGNLDGRLDPIRTNAVENFFADIRGDAEPIASATLVRVEPISFFKSFEVKPLEVGVMVDYRKPPVPVKTTKLAYETVKTRIGFVDDQGNYVHVAERRQPVRKA